MVKNIDEYLSKSAKTNDSQIEFGLTLGLRLEEYTVRVASAMIHDTIDNKFYCVAVKMASNNQIELGKKFGLDFSKMSRNVASAYIGDLMDALNFKSIKEQNFKTGDHVISNYDETKTVYIVSSIKDGCLFFKKGSGRKTKGYARYMTKINKEIELSLLK
jgi:hypothetical protein